MKPLVSFFILLSSSGQSCFGQSTVFTNYLRQFQTPSNVVWDASSTVAVSGSRPSDLTINPTGARFELWTIENSSPPKEYKLATSYVGSYVPVASVQIRSEDPYTLITRTRADRPFWVDVSVSGLLNGASDPDASKSVKFTRHTQSYGVGGTGVAIDRGQAILRTQSLIATNGPLTTTVVGLGNLIGWSDVLRTRGEERFTVYSVEDRRGEYFVGETSIASKFIQVWPVAMGNISGITSGATYKMALPNVQANLTDLYPGSTTYFQIYKGVPSTGTVGKVAGSPMVNTSDVPLSNAFSLKSKDYESLIDGNGQWTLELLTSTPFDVMVIDRISFNVDRTMTVNGSFTTIE